MLGSQRIRKVGTCGMSGMRCAVTEAMARTRPTSAISFDRLTGAKYICPSPRTTAAMASGALLNGTCTMSIAAALRNSAPTRNVVLARPAEEKFSVPGFAFASAMISPRSLAGTPGLTMRLERH